MQNLGKILIFTANRHSTHSLLSNNQETVSAGLGEGGITTYRRKSGGDDPEFFTSESQRPGLSPVNNAHKAGPSISEDKADSSGGKHLTRKTRFDPEKRGMRLLTFSYQTLKWLSQLFLQDVRCYLHCILDCLFTNMAFCSTVNISVHSLEYIILKMYHLGAVLDAQQN